MIELLYLFLGIGPSLAWLTYYLHKDNHPEPKRLVALSFLVGIVLSLPAVGLQFMVLGAIDNAASIATLLSIGAVFWFVMAFIEEGLKFAGMKWTAVPHPHFRQPVDAMIFMIVVALGFSAAENTLFTFALGTAPEAVSLAIEQAAIRGISATLLHALASAVVGYFFARSIAFDHNHRWHLFFGLLTATILHSLYNFSIIVGEGLSGTLEISVVAVLLIGTASLVSLMMRRLESFPSFVEEHSSEHSDSTPLSIS